jgi:hypothetical protein
MLQTLAHPPSPAAAAAFSLWPRGPLRLGPARLPDPAAAAGSLCAFSCCRSCCLCHLNATNAQAASNASTAGIATSRQVMQHSTHGVWCQQAKFTVRAAAESTAQCTDWLWHLNSTQMPMESRARPYERL